MKFVLATAFLLGTGTAFAQGCPQCQDNLRQTPPRTQRAYRHAIELMAAAGVTVFAGGAMALRRFR